MHWQQTSEESLRELHQLANNARARGDELLAVVVAGIDVFISLGREVELIEFMQRFESDIRPAVEGTPTTADLERLYNQDTSSNGTA